MRSLVAFLGRPDPPVLPIAWSGTDAAGRPLVLAHRGAAVGVATNEQGTLRAVLAGSLYNARQLRAGLTGRHALSGRDDAEVVVHLYEERGIQCVKALRGAFALVLWDERLQRLLLARDQLGLVPLYYTADGEQFAAASALPLLAALPDLAGTWDATALDAFLTLGVVPPPATFYTGIRQLGPGEMALCEGARVRTQRYWQLSFPERRMTRADVPALLREQMLEAFRLRQAGAVSGLLLSGGLDAAALLALATAERRLPARTYTGTFHDADEELRQAARLTARAGVEHVVAHADPDWTGAIDALLAAHGGPVAGAELVALHNAAQRARADVGIALAGIGAEEVFGGSSAVRSAQRIRRYRELPTLAREGAQLWARVAPAGVTAALRRLVEDERLAPLELYARSVTVLQREERASLYTPDALAMLADSEPATVFTALFADAVSGGATEMLDAMHYLELTLGLPARSTAAISAAAGLDLRLPLADHRLAQFVASVPPEHRGTARERQLLLRRALGDLLPAAVARQPRAASRAPSRAWNALLYEELTPARLAAHGFFRRETVIRLRDEHLSGRCDHGARLWAIVLATRWLDRQPAAAPDAVREAG